SALRGGAISFSGAAVNLVNSTIADNSASVEGSGIYLQSGSVMNLQNTVLWGNMISGGSHTEANSWVQSSPDGPPSSVSDPLFVNPLAGDYHLSAYSPLINSGNNAFVTAAMSIDLDGYPRVSAATVDIGGYELQSAAQSPILL